MSKGTGSDGRRSLVLRTEQPTGRRRRLDPGRPVTGRGGRWATGGRSDRPRAPTRSPPDLGVHLSPLAHSRESKAAQARRAAATGTYTPSREITGLRRRGAAGRRIIGGTVQTTDGISCELIRNTGPAATGTKMGRILNISKHRGICP